MKEKLSKKFWLVLIIFSLIGQVAWVVENMYFNVFIYKIFKATADDIALMVSLSAVSATLTSIFIGALSDKIGKRKTFMSLGYILWGVSIFLFAFIREDFINKLFPMAVSSISVGISLVIIMDCVMTFFGSSANDAAFNAWLTDSTNSKNRGQAEGINAMMPLVAILVVFGGFMAFDLDKKESWTAIFIIIGVVVFLIGVLGLFIIEEPIIKKDNSNYFYNIVYGFLPKTIKQNVTLYLSLLAFIIFNISIQVFMPYLIIYYEISLGMKDYVLIMAPAIIIASVVTALWGKVYDKKGFTFTLIMSLVWLIVGYLILYLFTNVLLVFIGSLLMMSGYLAGMAVFGAKIRDNIPSGKAGRLQGVRIVSQVLIPGIIGPYIGKMILRNADTMMGNDGTYSFIPSADIFIWALIVVLFVIPFIYLIAKTQKPKINNLTTDYEVGEIPFNVYPRQQLKRDSFINLNGEWSLNIEKNNKNLYSGKVIVPYPVESKLSKVERITKKGEILIYERTFNIDDLSKTTLIHFGAVDNLTKVYINDKKVGENDNGYLPFTFDITSFITKGINTIKVEVNDDTSVLYPYGKQKLKRGGMWYTPISGIWKTVWIEQVCKNYIKSLKLTPTLNSITIETVGGEDKKEILLNGKKYAYSGDITTIEIENPINWSPENPYLYNFTLISGNDKVESYFALREVKIDSNISNGIVLNNKPYFYNGLLDQGYYVDGIYTPANEKAYKDDILKCKELGFNMLRKHIKIEPDIFYYYCDKYGMIVFQDMVNNGRYSFLCDTALPTIGYKKKRLIKVKESEQKIFLSTAEKTLEVLYNYPSIIYYTIFNEGWGEHNATKIYKKLKEIDKTRIFDTASGWFKNNESDVQSEHVYFKPINLVKEGDKPLILSEFGGYSYKIEEHSYNLSKTYGYKICNSQTFMGDMENLYYNQIIPQIKKGLSAIVLTQVSDVEDETNGIFTYDRKVVKVDKEKMQKISKKLFETYYNYCK